MKRERPRLGVEVRRVVVFVGGNLRYQILRSLISVVNQNGGRCDCCLRGPPSQVTGTHLYGLSEVATLLAADIRRAGAIAKRVHGLALHQSTRATRQLPRFTPVQTGPDPDKNLRQHLQSC